LLLSFVCYYSHSLSFNRKYFCKDKHFISFLLIVHFFFLFFREKLTTFPLFCDKNAKHWGWLSHLPAPLAPACTACTACTCLHRLHLPAPLAPACTCLHLLAPGRFLVGLVGGVGKSIVKILYLKCQFFFKRRAFFFKKR